MSLFRELSYEGVDIDRIKSVQFCLLDPEDVKKRSVVKVLTTDTYIGNEPVINGIYDPRMGVTDSSRLCATCEQKSTFCPGHFGHIELAKPVFYYQFMQSFIRKILKCVCVRCSKLLYGLETPEMQSLLKKSKGIHRWNHVYKLCSKVTVCGQYNICGCGAKNPEKITKDSIKGFILEWKPGVLEDDTLRKQFFGAERVLEVFRRISDDDVEAMGLSAKYSRPEWMICTVLPVPPPAVRPCVHHDTGQRQEDDLSYTLGHIIKNNNTVAQKMSNGDKPEHIDGYALQLQYYIATLVENQIPGITPPTHKRSGRTLRSITDRLKGKEGRIRGNLMGKRVDFSARSVITPDPNISIDEVGVPLRIAMNLTFPEIVTEFNKVWLQELIITGPDQHPGSKMVRKVKEGGRTIRLKNVLDRSIIKLDIGDIVERHLIDGDYVLFNRQPSLHRMSMMGHRVRVMPFNTFRISTSVCSSFNADFDGDEMNLHVPQSYTTAIELEKLASVNTQIISPKNSAPIIEIVQDTVLGVWRITQDDVRIDERQMMNYLAAMNSTPPELPPAMDEKGSRYWTGKQLLSCIIPPHISASLKNNQGEKVSIVNGVITEGVVDKKIYQGKTRGLVHSVYAECGPEITRDLFDNTQRLVCNWLINTGFSVGVSDILAEENVKTYMAQQVKEMKQKVYSMIHNVHAGEFENTSLMSDGEFMETEINNTLNSVLKTVEKAIMEMLDKQHGKNRMLQMITSGSKGKPTNLVQMSGFLGQQNVEGKRIANGFEDRSLPHFTKYDDGPDARGFVENSFLKGLSPVEFFFHAMGGRDGLIDTAVKSLRGESPLIIIESEQAKYVKIGDWIDAHLDGDRKGLVKQYPNDRNMEVLELDVPVFIPTCDADGKTSWQELTMVTRHDPGERTYTIRTHGGRSVTVAESESLVVWNVEEAQFKPMHSTNVKIGDFLPVTASLSEPPIIIDHVDMTSHFPKTDYVYGTEFQRARMHAGRFVLPFTYQSNLDKIKNAGHYREGCIYPKKGKASAHFPDKFALDHDNGVFIGLFLADGNTDTPRNRIRISKEDKSVLCFLEHWFDRYGISHKVTVDQKKRGTSTSIIANSNLLALFLDAFVGKGSRNKFVPDVAFAAPLDFVRGILNGYFSGDGCIAPNGGIQSSSTSERLTEGIAALCSRIGIFAKMGRTQQKSNNIGTTDIAPAFTLSIRAQWARRFAAELDLVYTDKNDKLKRTRYAESHSNFEEKNDVVLDKIVSIEVTEVSDQCKKLYDVTVPTTLNFMLANGLTVRDTSEVGYIQRKLVKAMEDCKVYEDLTVRNASGQIVQFLYGEDGIDSTKLEAHKIVYATWTPLQFAKEYAIPEIDELAEFLDTRVVSDDYREVCHTHFLQLVDDRTFLFTTYIVRGIESPETITLNYPVAFERIINMVHSMETSDAELSDLDPVYAIKRIDKLVDDIHDPIKMSDLLGILARMYLSPKRLITKYRMTKKAFDNIIDLAEKRHEESLAYAGEMVGVLAAQSIGEPCTQQTLNTFHSAGNAAGSQGIRGVPRIKELLSATRKMKTPMMTVFPDKSIIGDKMACNDLMNKLQVLRFNQLVSRSRIYYDPSDNATLIPEDDQLLKEYQAYAQDDTLGCSRMDLQNPWVLRMEIDRDMLVQRGVTLLHLSDALVEAFENRIRCVYSDDSAATIIFRIRLDVDNSDDALTELRALESHMMENLVVWGIRNVSNATMREVRVNQYNLFTKMFETHMEWRLYLDGTDLQNVLSRVGVDSTQTVTNDVVEVHSVLGIEAARQALLNELNEVMGMSDINFRHISLLVDNMTCRGKITSVDRFGINRSDASAFSRAAFEEVVEMIVSAGVFSELDNMHGLSANIMTGNIPQAGTGMGDVIVNMDVLTKTMKRLGISDSQQILFDGEDDGDDNIDLAHSQYVLPEELFRFDIPEPLTDVVVVPLTPIIVA